jgi:uncharacterized protein YuzE
MTREAGAAYIRFSIEEVSDSAGVSSAIILDYDGDGRIVGMEVLGARAHLPSTRLSEAA